MITLTAAEGVTAVFLPELTLLRYPADRPGGDDAAVVGHQASAVVT